MSTNFFSISTIRELIQNKKIQNTVNSCCSHFQTNIVTRPAAFANIYKSKRSLFPSVFPIIEIHGSCTFKVTFNVYVRVHQDLSPLCLYIKYNSNCLNAAHRAFSFFFFRSSPAPTRCVIRARVYKIPIRLKKQFTNARLDRSVDREVFIDENAYRGHFNFQLTDRLVVVISMCV